MKKNKKLLIMLLMVCLLANNILMTSYAETQENLTMQNLTMGNADENKILAEKIEVGESIAFKEEKSLYDFMEYYITQYRLYNYSVAYNHEDQNGLWKISLKESMLYDRESLTNTILHAFGPVTGDTVHEKIDNACRTITAKMEYDVDYHKINIDKAIEAGRGVCWHYAKIAKVLLDEAGVETELLLVRTHNTKHLMIRCKCDDKWIYADPMLYETYGTEYSDIPYEKVLMEYEFIKNYYFQ